MIRVFLSKAIALLTLFCMANTLHAQMCSATETRIAPDSRYEVLAGSNGNEVRDTQTGLIWQRCSVGQRWDGQHCKGKPVALSWSEAKNTAQSLGLGYQLPSVEQLHSLTDRSCYNAAMNEHIFPNAQPDAYWSATPSATKFGHAWFVDFYYGMAYQDDRGEHFYIRAVRKQP